MKIKTLLTMVAATMLFSTAYAENTVNVLPVDLMTDTLTIEGQADSKKIEDIMIIVAKPGVNLNTITAGEDSLVQHIEKKSNADGSYKFSFQIRTDEGDKSGDYGVYVKIGDSAPVSKSFYFATKDDKNQCIKDINGSTSAELAGSIEDYVKKFGLNEFEAINGADAKDMADALKSIGTVSNGDYEKVQEVLKESAVLSSIKNGNTQYIFNADGSFISDSAIGFADFDKETGTSLYNAYKNILNAEGKQKVISALSGKTYSDYNALWKAFASETMLYSVNYTDIMGTEYLFNILTRENAAYVGINIDTYLSCTSKTRVHTELLKNSSYESLTALENKIAETVKNLPKDNSGSTGSSSNGGSSSGNSGNIGIVGPNASVILGGNDNAQNMSGGFTDVSDKFWAKEAIFALVDKKILSGFPDKSFKPGELLTREQALKIICEAFSVEDKTEQIDFDDVVKGSWYEKYISNGVAAGVVNGIGKNSFGVGKSITREDFAVMIYRAIGDESEYTEVGFADDGRISDYAKNAVAYFKNKGIINGYEDNTFGPKKSITRAEAAMIVYNCLKNN